MLRTAPESDSAPPRAATPVVAQPRLPVWLMAALLALVTIALYWPVTGYDFLNYDDPVFVTSNARVQDGLNWEGVKWAFGPNEGDYWHPLTWLSLMLDASFFGQRAGGFHFTNVALHAANGILLFLLLRMLTGALWRSVVVAALFALHPLRVESVAWVTERKDVLSGCFGLLALIFYARYAQGRECRRQKAEAGREGVSRPSHCLTLITHSTFYLPLSIVLRLRADEQGDAGDLAVCDAPARLLAAATFSAFALPSYRFHPAATGSGKDPVFCIERDLVRPHVLDGKGDAGSGWL